MKKFFIGVLAVLFVAGAAYAGAPAIDFSGMINTRGQYFSNDDGVTEDAGNYMIYDMEFDADINIHASDKSGVFINFEMHDQDWLTKANDSNEYTTEADDQIAIKRLFGYHTFDTKTKVEFGLLTGAAFGTLFGDNANGAWRIKVTQPTSVGVFVGVLEKQAENGPNATDDYDAEADDSDLYAVAYVLPMGDLKFMGLGVYNLVNLPMGNEPTDEEADLAVTVVSLNLFGNMGTLGFETEFVYQNFAYSVDFDADDYQLYGYYANVWATIDAMKVGGQLAYGSYDDDSGSGFGFGEDYCPTIGGADQFSVGDTTKSEYNAVTLLQGYIDYALNDEMNLGGSLTYWMSNSKDDPWEDAKGWEADVTFGWQVGSNCTYDVGLAQGQIDPDVSGWDPDPFTRIYHTITVNW